MTALRHPPALGGNLRSTGSLLTSLFLCGCCGGMRCEFWPGVKA